VTLLASNRKKQPDRLALLAPLAEATDRALGPPRTPIDSRDAGPPRPLTYDNLLSSHGPPRKAAGNPRGPWTSWAWGTVCALLAALFLFKGILPTGTTESPFPPGVQSVSARAAPELVTIPIEQIRVGLRVPGLNPELDSSQRRIEPDPDPATWRRLELRAPKTDGSWADVVLLRSVSWLQEQQAEVGGTVSISVPECGIDGNARVLAIGPCPPIPPGPGRVVTGTFRHASARVLDLHVEGLAESIGATANHPFWSEDRQEFVRADELEIGERVRTLHGTARLVGAVPRAGMEPVYNLEVQTEHVYHVTGAGVLVHNGGICPTVPHSSPTTTKRKSSRTIRLEWEKMNNRKWPKDKNGHNYDVSHKKALADGGTNDLDNIKPMEHSAHMQEHKDNGDFKRCGARGVAARQKTTP